MTTKETDYVKRLFRFLGRLNKIEILQKSNLSDYEIELLTKRFVNQLSLKDCADYFNIEANTVSKQQLKAVKKLYSYLSQ